MVYSEQGTGGQQQPNLRQVFVTQCRFPVKHLLMPQQPLTLQLGGTAKGGGAVLDDRSLTEQPRLQK